MQCKKSLVSIHESKRPPPYAQPPPMVSMGTKLKKNKENPTPTAKHAGKLNFVDWKGDLL